MAEACGIANLIALESRPGRLLTAMGELGVPLIEGEIGGRGRTTPENVRRYEECVLKVARYADVLEKRRMDVESSPKRTWRLGSIESQANGNFLRQAQLGQAVSAGDRLGVIQDVAGECVAEIRTPSDATIGGYRDHAGVAVGDTLFNLWLPIDAA
jgi:predicted deacylase